MRKLLIKTKKIFASGLILALILLTLAPLVFPPKAYAIFQQAYLRLDRMKASTATSGLVCAKPNVTGTETDVQVVFPTGFTVDTTAANWTVTTTNLPSGATAWVTIGTATAVSSQTVTFPSGDLTVGTLYCFNFSGTSTLTTGTAGANKTGTITTTTGAATIDTSGYATTVITDDQIAVTATVPQIFSFTLGGNSATLGTLSTSTTTSSTGVTLTIATNASAGWIAWVKNVGLTSVITGGTIPAAGTANDNDDTDLASATGYVLDTDITTDSSTGDGTVTQAANYGQEYDGLNTTSGGALETTLRPIAASNGTTDGDVLTMILRSKVSAVQAAATDYADTLTVVGAGRF